MESAVVVAVVAGISAVAAASVSALLSYRIAARKYELEHGRLIKALRVVNAALRTDPYPSRSLKHLKSLLHGMDEDEIRDLLIRAGAIRVDDLTGGEEMWADFDSPAAKRARLARQQMLA
ncbi:MAG: hypothetical protein AAFR65_11105 [Pseudomonadota bacterium]